MNDANKAALTLTVVYGIVGAAAVVIGLWPVVSTTICNSGIVKSARAQGQATWCLEFWLNRYQILIGLLIAILVALLVWLIGVRQLRRNNLGPGVPRENSGEQAGEEKKKDIWDRAQIVSGFVSSVVIAGIGLLLNNSIQRAQIRSSHENTVAQLNVADRNNQAQLELTKKNAEIQSQIQESTLTGQLVDHLASNSALRKEIAIVALRRSVPADMYQDVITLVVRSDPDPGVRETALEQATHFTPVQPDLIQAISDAINDNMDRSVQERQIASTFVKQFGLRSISTKDTFTLSSSRTDQPSFESPEFQGGIFTYFLVKGLSGAAVAQGTGSITLRQLADYVSEEVTKYTGGTQQPLLSAEGVTDQLDPVIIGPGSRLLKTAVIAVGNAHYDDPIQRLRYASSDAEKLAYFFQTHGAAVQLRRDATRREMLEALDTVKGLSKDTTLIFYYSGHSVVYNGKFWLYPVDASIDSLSATAISTEEINDILSSSPAGLKILFVDTAFSNALVGTR